MSTQNPTGIIAWFASNPVAANLLMLMIIGLGLMSYTTLRKEAFPPLEPDSITVTVAYESGDAKLVEEGITIKIEDALEIVPGIKRATSTSNAMSSTVTIEKKSDYSLDELLVDVKNKVDSIYNFPVAAENPVIEKQRQRNHALWVQLYGEIDRFRLQQLAEQLKIDLLTKLGISDISILGKAKPIISIEVDEVSLQSYGLTLSDVANAVNQESTTFLTTSLRGENKVLRLKVAEQAYVAKEFSSIPLIKMANGSFISLGDVAKVEESFEDDPQILSRYNGQRAIAVEIYSDEQGDITKIVAQAHEVIDQWHQRGLLPEGVSLDAWDDQSNLIIDRLSLLTSNALTGIMLVFIVLALFLNLRVAIWVAAGLPFVFCGALYFMGDAFAGLTINEMTTFGFILALGIVVDDAVVVGESVYATRQEEGDTLASTIKGTLKVATPTIFGVLTTVAAFISLANVEGMLGHVYAQFATIITICLLLSIVESKLILPSHLSHLNTRKIQGKRNLWQKLQSSCNEGLQWVNHRVYKKAITSALRFRYAMVLFFIALFIFVTGMLSTGTVRTVFFPTIMGSVTTSQLTMQNDASFGQTGLNLNELERLAIEADKQLMASIDPKATAIASIQLISEDDLSGSVSVELIPDPAYSLLTFEQRWKSLAGNPEGSKKLKFISSIVMSDNLKVELKSSNENTIKAAGLAFKSVLSEMAGVSGIDDNLSEGQPQLRFEITPQGYALGMDTQTLARQVLQNFGGEIVQRYQRNQDEVRVRIRYPENARQTLANVKQANVRTSSGIVLPLTTVANIHSEYQQDSLTRINGQRAVYLTAVVDQAIIAPQEVVNYLQQQLVPELLIQYPELSIHFAGEAEEQKEIGQSMIQLFLIALLAIYLLLAIPLKSYVQPAMIMTAIPFGVVGAILGHWWNDVAISILSINGIIALSGVVVNDSLLLVSRFNEVRQNRPSSNGQLPISELTNIIMGTCMSRFRPVLLTSITTFVGLAPLLGETSMQAQFLIPAAISLGYGIMFATLITLILIPALIMIQEDIKHLPQKFCRYRSARSA